MYRVLVLTFAAMSITVGCATQTHFLEPIGVREDATFYYQGHKVVSGSFERVTIAGYAVHSASQVQMQVYVRNDSTKPIDIGPQNLTVERIGGSQADADEGNSSSSRAQLDVFTKQEYLARLQRQRNAAIVGAAFAGAASSFSAGMQSSSTTGSYTGTTPGGDTVTGTYSENSNSYDPSAAAAAQANTQAQIDSIEQNYRSQLAAYSQALLGRTTLSPGQEIAGVVVAEDYVYPGDEYIVTISVRENQISLRFSVQD
mgnify:CR=1 FL=1